MSDNQTERQRVADLKLEDAVETLIDAYRAEDGQPPGVLVDYLVITAEMRVDDDGEHATLYGLHSGPGYSPLHRSLGLLEAARSAIVSEEFGG